MSVPMSVDTPEIYSPPYRSPRQFRRSNAPPAIVAPARARVNADGQLVDSADNVVNRHPTVPAPAVPQRTNPARAAQGRVTQQINAALRERGLR